MEAWKKSVSCAVLAGGMLVAALGVVPAVAVAPTDVEGTRTINCDEEEDPDRDLVIVFRGKEKEIKNASGLKYISPGLKATVTNSAGESVTYTVTGTVRPEPPVEGEVRVRATGRNILTAATAANPTEAFLTSGSVTFVVDEEGNEVTRFAGPGNVTDLCEEFA